MVQKRSIHKKSFPGVWSVPGGAVISGESSRSAAVRELAEEMGILLPHTEVHFVDRIRLAHAFLDIWSAVTDLTLPELTLQPEEVDDARYISPAEFLHITAPTGGRYTAAYQLAITRYLRREGLLPLAGQSLSASC